MLKKNSQKYFIIILFNVRSVQFEGITTDLRPLWSVRVLEKYNRPWCGSKLEFEVILLIMVFYCHIYIPKNCVGFLFGIKKYRVPLLMRRLESLLAKNTAY